MLLFPKNFSDLGRGRGPNIYKGRLPVRILLLTVSDELTQTGKAG